MKRQGEQAKKPLRSTGETQASPSGDVSLRQDDLGCEDSDSWGWRSLLDLGAARQALTALVCGDSVLSSASARCGSGTP